MPSTQQVAETLGIPYTTLLKWQSNDRLLRPILGGGGRRGGDLWPRREVEIARAIVRLRDAGLPLRLIRQVVEALREWRAGISDVSVYLDVRVHCRKDGHPYIAGWVKVEGGANRHDPTQLSCL